MSDVIMCATGEVLLHADGYVRVDQVSGAVQDQEGATELLEAIRTVSGGRKVALVVLTNQSRTTRDGRLVFADLGSKVLTCCALVVQSRISEVSGNFFLRLNKPAFPMRLFQTEDAAIVWASTFISPQE